ncbi:MAG TPA: type II CAAX endopeptidase family protein [Pyrinomonadaceae bacterium]|nr:type II CAAX endopeptidase family protein [Pyrinomonadaceae bacterium]
MEITNQEPENEIAGIVPAQIQTVPFPSPNNPPWNTPAAIGTWIASVVFILIFPNLFLLPYLSAKSVHFSDSAKLLEFLLSDPTAIIINVLAIIPAHALTIAVAWMVVTRFRKFSFRETLGWNGGSLAWWYYPALLIGFFAVGWLIGNYFPDQENDLSRILKSSRTAVYLVAFLATFTAPIVEEVIYRGVLYSALQRTFGMSFAVVLVTFLFALVHVPQYWPSYSTIFLLTLLSLTLTLIRARTGNLLPCIIFHFIFNGIQSLGLVLAPFLEKPETQVDPVSAILRFFQ